MAVKTKKEETRYQEEVAVRGAPDEVFVPARPVGTVGAAAAAAAEAYAPDEIEKHAQAIIDALVPRLKQRTDEYTKQATAINRGETLELAEPWTPAIVPYPWWNLLMFGPFQPAPAPGGPFLPHKIFQAAEPAFMIGIVWLNPAPINWLPPGPSAATVMSAFDLTIRCETINLTNVVNGPDPAPVVMSPIGASLVTPFLAPFIVSIGGGFFPAPPEGNPHHYEMNVLADVSGPAGALPLPFAGYSTWLFDPDLEPAIFPPPLRPPVLPAFQYDIPCRFLVYTA